MSKILLSIFTIITLTNQLPAQNLVVNPDAESLPRGTGWTIVSEGASTCALVPTSNYLNWTMQPNGTANYPYDHTTGANGGTVFFSGCDTYFQGPFELYQVIDVSADAATIDIGNLAYDFSGYIQTPVSPQTDRGRFIVEFLNAADAVLGTSYNSGWQSNFGGSGTAWKYYSNTRTAPAGTRKIKIRMQTELLINQPAINVYFDDISLTRPVVLPTSLIAFTATEMNNNVELKWKTTGEVDYLKFELQRSNDAIHFAGIATFTGNNTSYHFVDVNNIENADRFFYRLKMVTRDGKIEYSNVLYTKAGNISNISLHPNPANNSIRLNGLQPGTVSVIHLNGSTAIKTNVNSLSLNLDVSKLPAGIYILRHSSKQGTVHKKLIIQH